MYLSIYATSINSLHNHVHTHTHTHTLQVGTLEPKPRLQVTQPLHYIINTLHTPKQKSNTNKTKTKQRNNTNIHKNHNYDKENATKKKKIYRERLSRKRGIDAMLRRGIPEPVTSRPADEAMPGRNGGEGGRGEGTGRRGKGGDVGPRKRVRGGW